MTVDRAGIISSKEEVIPWSCCAEPPEEQEQWMPPINPYASIFSACATSDVPAWLMSGISYETSKFNPNARGTSGEIGLFQLLPQYFSNCGDLYDPQTNACCGAAAIQKHYDRVKAAGGAGWENSIKLALMGNNMGGSWLIPRISALSGSKTWKRFKAAYPDWPSKYGWVEQMYARGVEYKGDQWFQYAIVGGSVIGAGLLFWWTVR